MPLARVDGLLPGTEYEARVSLHDDQERGTLGESTETTRFTTDGECSGRGTKKGVLFYFSELGNCSVTAMALYIDIFWYLDLNGHY